jgi:ankyrin repeat protein
VNAADQSGLAPLHLASRKGHIEVIKMLTAAQEEAAIAAADGHGNVIK